MLDIANFIKKLNSDTPCGTDPEYSSEFMAMEKAMQGEPERQIGDSIIPAIEPDWKTVKTQALNLSTTSRDLRVITNLTIALLYTDGFNGFADGLDLIDQLLVECWDCLHPQLDEDDANPALMRSNTITMLVSDSFINSLNKQPLLFSKQLGKFSIQDIQEGLTYQTSNIEEEKQKYRLTEAIFQEGDTEQWQTTIEVLNKSQEFIKNIIATFKDKVGSEEAPNLSRLQIILAKITKILTDRLKIALGQTTEPLLSEQSGSTPNSSIRLDNSLNTLPAITKIQSRDQVINALDLICDYYSQYEPSSPVPFLLRRASRLVNKEFIDIIKDLNPESTELMEQLFGLTTKE